MEWVKNDVRVGDANGVPTDTVKDCYGCLRDV